MDLGWLGLIIPGGYIIVSTFFLCFPNILHKKHKYKYPPFNDLIDSDMKFCIGHRGGGWQAPQNTMEVFQLNNQRVHMFELDVCLTKDKKLVVHHDSSLSRTCGVNQEISDLNYQNLPKFKPEIQTFMGEILKTNQNRIILLEELFQRFPDKPMNIELKYPTLEGIEEFNRIVRKFQRQNITVWGAAGSLNQNLRKSNPQTVNFYSAGQILKIYMLFLTGLLPFVCIRQGVMDIPLLTEGFERVAKNFATSGFGKCLLFFAVLVLKCFNFFSWIFIRHLKKRGILTFYFILNEQQDFENAFSKGCSGVMTDVTAKLEKYLKNNNNFYQQNKAQLNRP